MASHLVFFLALFFPSLFAIKKNYDRLCDAALKSHELQIAENAHLSCVENEVLARNLLAAAQYLSREFPKKKADIEASLADVLKQIVRQDCEPLVLARNKILAFPHHPKNASLAQDWPNWQVRWRVVKEEI